MKKNTTLTPEEQLHLRMKTAYDELRKIAKLKIPAGKSTLIHGQVGAVLGITGQTVFNYLIRTTIKSNGFLIEALIEEFKKLPGKSGK